MDFKCLRTKAGELGEGGFGVVRLGFHHQLGKVALKCFRLPRNKEERVVIQKRYAVFLL